jgi:hypothetical protein
MFLLALSNQMRLVGFSSSPPKLHIIKWGPEKGGICDSTCLFDPAYSISHYSLPSNSYSLSTVPYSGTAASKKQKKEGHEEYSLPKFRDTHHTAKTTNFTTILMDHRICLSNVLAARWRNGVPAGPLRLSLPWGSIPLKGPLWLIISLLPSDLVPALPGSSWSLSGMARGRRVDWNVQPPFWFVLLG